MKTLYLTRVPTSVPLCLDGEPIFCGGIFHLLSVADSSASEFLFDYSPEPFDGATAIEIRLECSVEAYRTSPVWYFSQGFRHWDGLGRIAGGLAMEFLNGNNEKTIYVRLRNIP